jgi:Tfp pilus assembly protein PilO/LysM repeat protein
MAKDKRKKNPGKQFTTRETVLLIVLGFAAVIYGFYTFILLPTMEEIAVLETENQALESEYTQRLTVINQKEGLLTKLNETASSLAAYKKQYFPTTNQEHFIKVLETEIIDEDLDVESLSFTGNQPTTEFISEEGQQSVIHSSIVNFPFSGTYESFMDLIRRVEQYGEMIRINSLDVTYKPMPERAFTTSSQWVQSGYYITPLYQGNIAIEFFTIPQDYENPWYSTIPDYNKAQQNTDSLFLYDDGGLSIPPFFVEREEDSTGGQIVSGEGSGSGTTGSTGGTGSTGSTGSTGGTGTGGSTVGTGSTGGTGTGTEETPSDDAPATYLVKPGDTLFSISMKFYQSKEPVEDIMALNNITSPYNLQSGSVIKLPYYGK